MAGIMIDRFRDAAEAAVVTANPSAGAVDFVRAEVVDEGLCHIGPADGRYAGRALPEVAGLVDIPSRRADSRRE